MLEKVAALKRFEYSLLGKELKNQKVLVKNITKILLRFLIMMKKIPVKIKKEGPLTSDDPSLFYNNKYSFSEFKNVRKYMDDSLV